MIAKPAERIDHPAAWKATDLGSKDDIAIVLEERHLGAFDAAMRRSKALGVAVESLTAEIFPLTSIQADIEAWRRELADGRGLVLLRGFPITEYDNDDVGRIFFGLGTHFGTAVSQSNLGDRLGHVIDVGGTNRRERAYRNRRALGLHTDRCDYIGMLCLQKARSGGISGYASAMAIHNEILASRPDLLEPLYAGYRLHRFGEQPPGESPITPAPVPVFSSAERNFNVVYIRGYVDLAVDEGLYGLDVQEREALDYFDEIANRSDIRADFLLDPGEATLTNNCLLLHTRTAFEDYEEPERKRHLLRLWLVDSDRPAVNAVRAHKNERGIDQVEGRGTYYSGKGFK